MNQAIDRFPRTTFFFSGLLLSAASFWAQARWREIANDWFGLSVGYDTRPPWLVVAMGIVTWLPWVAAGLVIALRFIKGKRFKALAFGLGAVTPPLALVGFLFLQLPIQNFWYQQEFKSAAWIAKEGSDSQWPSRLTMIDDLMERKLLDGRSEEEVLALLGPGEDSGYWRDWDAHYWLGPERGMIRIDSEWLVIRFNAEGRVAEYAVVRD